MRCGNGDTVRRKRGKGKGLRERWGSEKIVEICSRVKTAPENRRVDWIRAKAPFGSRVCFWLEDRSKFGRKEPSMMLIGCDYHPSWQQICWLDTESGETGEKKLEHASGEAKKFYRGLPGPALIGMESTGNCQWFVEMAATLGHHVWIGDVAKIRAAEVRQQKHDRRDAALILKLLLEGRFPRIWTPSGEEKDLRQLLIHRYKLVRIRAQVKTELQHLDDAAGSGADSAGVQFGWASTVWLGSLRAAVSVSVPVLWHGGLHRFGGRDRRAGPAVR